MEQRREGSHGRLAGGGGVDGRWAADAARMRFSKQVYPNETINTVNLHAAKSGDIYFLRGAT